MSDSILKRLSIAVLLLSSVAAGRLFAGAGTTVYDPISFGAKADGRTVDTAAIQEAIDRCTADGGGTVPLKRGTYVSGTIVLKDNVTLHLEKGAVLKASDHFEDFPNMPSKRLSYSGKPVTNLMMIYAEDAENIGIAGEGMLDGNGDFLLKKKERISGFQTPTFSGHPRQIHFRNCRNVTVRDIAVTDTSTWSHSYQSCEDVLIRGVQVGRYKRARIDGIDIVDCRRVRMSDCDICSGDDGICLKSFSTEEKCSDITITDCIVRGACGIKCGTESVGGFEDITINNCVFYDCGLDAVSLLSMDGASLRRITVSNIVFRDIKAAPIILRLGARDRLHDKSQTKKAGILKDILIENIQGRHRDNYSCLITGIPGRTIENVTLRNINLEFVGRGTLEDAFRPVPENEKSYPSGTRFGTLPAYGLYARHVKNLVLDNLRFRHAAPDERPALVCDDVESLRVLFPYFQCSPTTPGLIRLIDVREALISGAVARGETPLFLHVSGGNSREILLRGNHPGNIGTWFDAENDAVRKQVQVR